MTRTRSADPLTHLAAVAAPLGRPGQPGPVFDALEQAMGATLGHKLFTILRYHSDANESERIYSNQPTAYPVGGRKPVRETPSTACVIGRRDPTSGARPTTSGRASRTTR